MNRNFRYHEPADIDNGAYYQKPVEMNYLTTIGDFKHCCYKEISIIKNEKKATTYCQNTNQNYGSYRLGHCYKNKLKIKKEYDKREISIESCLIGVSDKAKIKGKELTKSYGVLEADLLKQKYNVNREGKAYEEDFDDIYKEQLKEAQERQKVQDDIAKMTQEKLKGCKTDMAKSKKIKIYTTRNPK
ncbi:hypothetical protein C2G38_2164951 [Gigaspora rosea]|uniref:Uncharacterized protein n=1 Tax=Gigaspora rosea TaxID=44941 RepID=A0A397VV62_9GLOM|nr:hypothetical protein C2G38_2164951 [Gigaspora rosea]